MMASLFDSKGTTAGGAVCEALRIKKMRHPKTCIVAAALVRFKQGDCRFDDRATYKRDVPDGRPVHMLSDESAPFTLEG